MVRLNFLARVDAIVERRGAGTLPRVLFALGAMLCAGPGETARIGPPDLGLLVEQNRIKKESEEKIQRDILDPILGPGKAMVFVDVEMELRTEREESQRAGMGLAERYKERVGASGSAGAQTLFILPGIPKPKTVASGGLPEKPESVRAQQSQQTKGIEEERYSVKPVFKRLEVKVFHDDAVLKAEPEKKTVRERIVDAMGQYQLQPDQVVFRSMPFKKTLIHWSEDIKRPAVYLPLLYALLLLLLLGFLFGPLAHFFRQYVSALREKPGAEVNIQSKTEAPDEKKEGGGNPLNEEGKLDISLQNKPPQPPLEEDENMKKFEPFSYINEENMKRLIYLFLLNKEEPWVIAVVASYLRPDFARLLLTSLPIELQSKVALEALMVRQMTREQVVAINNDIRDKVNFVVGGIERLVGMLDEADSATRNNILNYLKNDKPAVYERVRKYILIFEDVVNFPDREMQTVVRELKTESMARALQNAPPDIVNKFFSNMSAGAGALLREAMEYTRGLTPAQIDEERAKVLDLVKVLEKEGKIAVREKPQEGMGLDNLQFELGSRQRREQRVSAESARGSAGTPAPVPAATDPAEARRYYDAGAAAYAAGQMAECVSYLEYALTQDPGLLEARQYLGNALYQLGRTNDALGHFEALLRERPDPQLQAWVDGLKTQVGT